MDSLTWYYISWWGFFRVRCSRLLF